jgi:hypothetical protein
MPDLAKIEAVATKLEGAEPASDPTTASPDGGSGAGPAPSDSASGGDGSTGPATEGAGTAAPDTATLQAKLQADRERREAKARRKKIADDEAAAKKAREEAEADRKAAAEKAAKLGKGTPWREHLEALGLKPTEVFREMQQEALKAGTPEAQIEAMGRAFQEQLQALEEKLSASEKSREEERTQREEESKKAANERAAREFQSDFHQATQDERFAPLLDEYPAEKLFRIVDHLKENPAQLFQAADRLGVRLQDDGGSFTMFDIFNVCLAEQTAHRAHAEEMQRRKQSAAPQTSQAGPKQPPSVKPTVNGTAVKNAGALGNQIATDRASEAGAPPRESRADRVKRLGEKYG